MVIRDLSLRGFRNYESFDCAFAPGVNLILGENAQGKTNLLEAICYLSRGAAFRTRKEAELIRFGAEFAELSARVDSYGREQTLRAVLFASRRPRQLFLSGVKKSTREDLDGIDRDMAALFERRMDVCRKIARWKLARGLPVRDAAREEKVLDSRAAMVRDERLRGPVRELWSEIMRLSRAEQERIMEEGPPC